MEQLLDKIVKAPLLVKAGVVAALVVLLTAVNFFMFVQPAEADIARNATELREANRLLAEKRDYAQNLNDKRQELTDYEQRLQEALTQLPEQKDVEELLAQLNDVGKKAGLQISEVQPMNEVATGTFVSRIPVKMNVAGNYHEIAMFLQEVSTMRRIVNVEDISFGLYGNKAGGGADKVMLKSAFVATAFRFVDTSKQSDSKKKGKSKGKKK